MYIKIKNTEFHSSVAEMNLDDFKLAFAGLKINHERTLEELKRLVNKTEAPKIPTENGTRKATSGRKRIKKSNTEEGDGDSIRR